MNFPYVVYTDNVNETENTGKALAETICEDKNMPRFVAMYGDLGVGKTAFVRGFSSSLCLGANVKSPTFSLVNEYKCQKNSANIKKVCHFDMYRIADEDDLYSIGYYDYLSSDAVCIAEWCELIPYALPEDYLKVEIEKTDMGDGRKITISHIN